jgi:hypothetical protein
MSKEMGMEFTIIKTRIFMLGSGYMTDLKVKEFTCSKMARSMLVNLVKDLKKVRVSTFIKMEIIMMALGMMIRSRDMEFMFISMAKNISGIGMMVRGKVNYNYHNYYQYYYYHIRIGRVSLCKRRYL